MGGAFIKIMESIKEIIDILEYEKYVLLTFILERNLQGEFDEWNTENLFKIKKGLVL